MKLIFLDENFSQYFAESLNALEKREAVLKIESSRVLGVGVDDLDLIPRIAESKGVLITKDTDFKKIQLHQASIKKHRIGVFFFHLSKGTDFWTEIQFFYKAWPEVRRKILKNPNPPYLFEFKTNGKVKELPI